MKSTDLPFVREEQRPDGSGRHFWSVTPSGNSRADIATGVAYARAYLEYYEAQVADGFGDMPAVMLAWIVKDMPRDTHGRLDRVAMSFLNHLARVAFRGRHEGCHFTAKRRRKRVPAKKSVATPAPAIAAE